MAMTDQKTEQQFIDAIKHRFDQSVDQIDAGTLSGLNSIRHNALKRSEPFSISGLTVVNPFLKRALTPLVAVACVAIIIFTLVQPDSSSSPFIAEDIEMLSTSDGIDFYENLEFYQWLEDYEISA